jgi:hypothetical protein
MAKLTYAANRNADGTPAVMPDRETPLVRRGRYLAG